MELTKKDLKKLRFVLEKIRGNTACSFDKQQCVDFLESVVEPRCAVCRQPLGDDVVIVNDRKIHSGCTKHYRGAK